MSRQPLTFVLAVLACGAPAQNPSPECKAYVRCYEATGGSRLDADYTESWGTCWTTTQAARDACTSACTSALEALDRAYPDAGCTVPAPPPVCGFVWDWPPWTCR